MNRILRQLFLPALFAFALVIPAPAAVITTFFKVLDEEAERVVRVLVRDEKTETTAFVKPDAVEQVSTKHLEVLPGGELVWESVPNSFPKDELSKLFYVDSVVSLWPQASKEVIEKAERNNIEWKWDSLYGYQSSGEAFIKQAAAQSHETLASEVSSADALAASYLQELGSLLNETREVDNLFQKLMRAHQYKLPKDISGLSDSFNLTYHNLHDGLFFLDSLAGEFSSDVLSPKLPAKICDGWPEDAKAGFCLNRLLLLKTRGESIKSLNQKLKPLVKKFTKPSDLWKMQNPNQKPESMVEFYGNLETDISQTPAEDKILFDLLSPVTEASLKLVNAKSILNASLDDVVVLNLLPTVKSQTITWDGYTDEALNGYVEWGQRVHNILNSRNVLTIQDTSTPDAIRTQINQARATRKILMIIGESQDSKSIRLPGSASLPTSQLVPSDMTVVGLFCGSADSLRQVAGLAVSGTLKADEAVAILKKLIKRAQNDQPTTVSEFINDSLIYASHRKGALLLIGGVSVGIKIVPKEPKSPAQPDKAINNTEHIKIPSQ